MKKLVIFISVVAAVLALLVVAITRYLPREDTLKKAEAIVAISGGDTHGRAQHAVDLYKQGYAPKLIFSGAAKDPASASNARVMMAIAVSQGVSTKDISLDETSRDTKENASSSQQLAKNYDSIILVTSPYHQRRAYKEFRRAYGDQVEIINSPAEDKNWPRHYWWLTAYGWWIGLSEPVKLALSQ